jgi:filamentous hemagglutinin family protein
MTTTTSNAHAAYRPWSVRTVVVRLSRKLSATYRIRSGRRLSQLLAVLLATVSPWAVALPEGGQVVAGQASVSTPSANGMVVNQASDKAVLNWQSFNIGTGQSMQFVQPGAASVALNRVIGNGASSIFGSLSANGQVFLVNPSGVMFAPGAQVNVGGLVASSMDISNGDFMAGRYSFSGGGAGAVSNHGSINAAPGGYVLLAAPQVTNTGAITAEAGSVGLLAGSRVSVDTSGVGLVRFSVDAAAAQAAINNSGSITANGGQVAVLASAMGDAMATVINQSGVIRADSAVERNGTIVLSGGATGIVNVSGELSAAGTAAGQTGGTVKVLGDKVALTGAALIDASGQAGGGTVLVGGNYQGHGPEQNATGTFVGSDVRIKADAVQNGQGGTVVVWADDSTRFHGSISARGGSQGGDGGQVETSGKEFLVAAGSVDASAARGQGGVWLLDPRDVTIANAATSGGAYAANVFTPTADNAVADRNTIQTALNGGTNVTINTGATGTQAGNITVADSITKSAGAAATLTLTAAGSILVNNTVSSSSNALNVNLNAAGATTFSAAGSLATNGGNVAITGTGAKTLGNITTTGTVGTGNLTVGASGAVSQLASTALVVKGATAITAGAVNDVTLTNTGNDFTGAVSVVTGNNVAISDASALALGTSAVSGGLTLAAGGSVTQTGIVNAATLSATLTGATSALNLGTSANNIAALGAVTTPGGFTLTNGNNAVAVNGAIATTNTAVSITSGTGATSFGASGAITSGGGNVTFVSTNAAKVLGNIDTTGGTLAGNLLITGAGAVSQGAGTSLKVKGTTTIAAGAANDVLLNQAGNDFTGAVITSGKNITLTDANALVLGTTTANAGGALTLAAGGSVTQTGVVTAPSLTATLTGAASALNLGTQTNKVTQLDAITAPGGFTLTNGNNAVAINGAIATTDTNVSIASGSAATTFGAAGSISSGGGNVALTSTVAKVLGSINTTGGAGTGNLTIGTAGAVSQLAGTSLAIKGATTIAAGAANSITLNNAGNDFTGAVSVTSGLNVSLIDANALVLGTSTIAGMLGVNTSGAITQNGALIVGGATTLAAGAANDITLATTTNNFASVAVTSGNNVSLRDTNALTLGGSAVSGNLAVTTNGGLIQSGAIAVAGTTTVTAGAANSITLNNAGNDFTGAVSVVSGLNVSLADANALVLGTSTVAGTLGVNTSGAITQSGALAVTGAATLAAGAANDITLNNATNAFANVAVTSGNNVSLRDGNGFGLGTSTVSGNLAVAAGGSVTQTGIVNAATLSATLTGATSALNLGTSANNIAALGTITTPGGFSLNNGNNAVAINGAIAATNTAVSITSGTGATTFGAGGAITSGGGNVTFTSTNAAKVLGNIDTTGGTLAGNLLVTGTGAVAQGAGTTLKVKGTTTIAAGATNDVVLSQAGNDFTGAVITSGKNITLTDSNALVLGTTTANTGGALILAAGGSVTQTGVVTAPTLTATLTGAASALNLGSPANNIAALGAITTPGGFTLANGNNAVAINGAIATTDTAVSIASGSAATSFGATGSISSGGGNVALTSTVAKALGNINTTGGAGTGNLAIGTAGAVSQLAGTSLAIKGATTIAAGAAGNVALNNAGNNFGGAVGVTTGNNVGITGAGALVLGAMTVSGALDVSTSGAITQSGAVTVTGATTLAAGAANDITLTNASNNFAKVGIASGNNVSLSDSNGIVLDTSTVASSLTVKAGGTVTQTGALLAPTLNVATYSTAGSAITLTNTGNDASTVNLQVANGTVAAPGTANANAAILYTDANAVTVAGINNGTGGTAGAVTLLAGDAITQTGAIKASTLTATTANAAGAAITLAHTGNDAATVNLQSRTGTVAAVGGANAGAAIQYTDATGVGISGINSGTGAGGNVTLVTGGAITQTGAIKAGVLSARTLNNTPAAITLTNAGNDAASIVLQTRNAADTDRTAAAIAYTDANAVVINGINAGSGSTATGTLALVAGGAVTQTGAIIAGGATSITAGSANDVTLNNAGNDFTGAVSIVSGNRVAITDANALQLGVSSASTSLAVVAGGAISQTGAVTTPTLSAKTLSAGTANITLTNAGNEAATVDLRARNLADTANAAGAIAYRDTTGFDVAAVNTTGALTLQSGGNITQSGAVSAASLAVAGTGTGSLNLGTQANSIATLNAITAAGGFALNNGNNGTTVAGNISTTNGAVSIDTGTGTYTQSANIDVLAGSGPITVTADTIAIAANTGNNALATSGVLTLKAKTAGRAMSLSGAAGFDLTAAELTAIATGATGSIVIGDAASTGTMTIGAPVTLAGKTLTLNAGSITDTGVQTITAQNLTLNANGQIGSNAANGIDVAAPNLSVNTSGNANAFVRSAGALNLGGTASNVGSGTLDLTALGAITQTAGTGNITAGTLQARTLVNGGAAITLNNSGNDAGTVNLQALNAAGTANAPAAIAYTDANAVTVSGINNGTGAAGAVTLAAGGTVTQTGAVNASTLAATLTGAGSALNLGTQANNVAQLNAIATPGGFSLDNGNNTVLLNGAVATTNTAVSITSGTAATSFAAGGSIASNGGDVTLTNSAAKVLGSIDTTGGSAAGNLALAGPGAVSQAAATALRVKGTTAVSAGAANNVALANSGNDFGGAVAVVSGNNVSLTDSNALVLDTSTVSGTLNVSAGGAVTQSGALAASGLALTGAGSSYVLAHAGNAVTTLAANTGSLDYKQAGALTVGTVGATAGVTATGAVKIETTGAASSLTLNNAVSSSATGDAVVLKAGSSNAAGVAGGGQLVNNVGAGGIVAASGRYLAYSGDPGATLEGVAGYNKRYNSDAAYVPAGSASTFLYRIAPTLTVTADNKTKVYGDSNPVLTGVVGGLIDGDTAAGVGVGYATTAVDRTAVAAGPVAITTSATNNENYTLALTNGALNITQRALTVTATGQNRVYDGTTAAGVTLADNRLAGDVLTAGNTSASFTDKNAGIGKTVNVAASAFPAPMRATTASTAAATTTANITPATIANVSGITAADKVQDGTTAATLATGGAAFAGRIGATC